MAYSDFDLKTVVQRFGLTEVDDANVFQAVAPVQPGAQLEAWLAEYAPVAVGINSEQARNLMIIFPVLAEAKRQTPTPVTVMPGVTLEVDKAQGLSGHCDYLITRSGTFYYIQAPVVAVVEAKREDLIAGLGQCASALVAIRLFNERENTPVPAVYGAVSSGSNWRFLKLQDSTLFIDRTEYYLHDLPTILGILVAILRG